MLLNNKKKFYQTLESFPIGKIEVCDKTTNNTKIFSGNDSSKSSPEVVIEINDWNFLALLVFKGEIGFAEGYIKKLWDTPDLISLISYFAVNINELGTKKTMSDANFIANIFYRIKNSFFRKNTISGSRNNIHSHYDLGNNFYSLWLDKTMSYSSGLFGNESLSLEQAQINKCQRILRRLPDGEKLLEIGCGWGSFIEESLKSKKDVYAITISDQQFNYVSNKYKNSVDVKIQDYRNVEEKFDNIVSIEMFEAVGREYWEAFYKKIKSNLTKGGKAIIQTIYIDDKYYDEYQKKSDYIREYIFPGGFLPSIPQMERVINDCRLKITDTYHFGKDYSKTLTTWYHNFSKVSKKVREIGFDDSFIRTWCYYLAYCNAGFASERIGVGQFEIKHD